MLVTEEITFMFTSTLKIACNKKAQTVLPTKSCLELEMPVLPTRFYKPEESCSDFFFYFGDSSLNVKLLFEDEHKICSKMTDILSKIF